MGMAMVSGGMPVYEVEEELRRIAWKIGHPSAQVSATPTAVWVSLSQGEAASIAVIKGMLRLDQSFEVNIIRRQLLAGTIDQETALSRIGKVRSQSPHLPWWGSAIGAIFVATGLTLIMQPGWINVLVAGLLAVVSHTLIVLSGKHRLLATLLPTIASFVVAIIVLYLSSHGVLVGPLRTLITPLAIILPGATLSTGMAELAAGSMVAGSSRFIYGGTTLLMMAAGIVGAEKLIGVPSDVLANTRIDQIGWIGFPIGLVAIAIGMGLQESIPPRIIPFAFGNLTLTFLVQLAGQYFGGGYIFGTFLGAIVASFAATLIDALRPDAARLVVFLPAFWLLVPGSLGLIGITEMGNGADFTAISGVLQLILMIALGLLMGSAFGRPFYRIARRYSATHGTAPKAS